MKKNDEIEEGRERCLAHKIEDGAEESIKDHSMRVGKLASQFAAKFGAEDFGRQCGEIHDIGKYSRQFQRRIRGENIRVDHSTFGAKELIGAGDEISAFCVAGHHTGLPDGGSKIFATAKETTLYGRIRRELPDASIYKEEIKINELREPDFVKNDRVTRSFFIRMLFSCLVDADYLSTESFMKGENELRGIYPDLTMLKEKLAAHIADNGLDNLNTQNRLNQIRAEVLVACQQKALSEPGIFTLSAPTGAGKTKSSLAFALEHAIKYGKDRIIYVAPYKTIIDQTADVFEKIFEGMNAVLAHHSGADFDFNDEKDEKDENFHFKKNTADMKKFAAENWDMPIVVTTAVQFFESLYGSRPSKCRKIHNIANSVVVFDEGQALPLSYLKPCMEAIKQLVEHYNTTVLFMSATQPAFDQLLIDRTGQPLKRTEIISDVSKLTNDLARTTFYDLDELELVELVAHLREKEQFLCIVNSRRSGRTLLNELDKNQHTYLLTTLMTYADRKKILDEIETRLKNHQPCQVIATSLIEAGVDIDFPVVYREKFGLDSLIQAAGRCNRNNENAKEKSFVYSFDVPEFKVGKVSIYSGSMQQALNKGGSVDDPETIEAYFGILYNLKGKSLLDQEQILQSFDERTAKSYFPFRNVDQKFRMIDNNETTVYISNENNQELIGKAKAGTASRFDYRKLGKYAVSVPSYLLSKIKLEEIGERSYVLLDKNQYDERYGLTVY